MSYSKHDIIRELVRFSDFYHDVHYTDNLYIYLNGNASRTACILMAVGMAGGYRYNGKFRKFDEANQFFRTCLINDMSFGDKLGINTDHDPIDIDSFLTLLNDSKMATFNPIVKGNDSERVFKFDIYKKQTFETYDKSCSMHIKYPYQTMIHIADTGISDWEWSDEDICRVIRATSDKYGYQKEIPQEAISNVKDTIKKIYDHILNIDYISKITY